MLLQVGAGQEGPWTTAAAFSGAQDSSWVSAPLEPPTASRWWRLLIVSNWGAYDYVWLHGFALRIVQDAQMEDWRHPSEHAHDKGEEKVKEKEASEREASEKREKERRVRGERKVKRRGQGMGPRNQAWSARQGW